MSRKRIKLDEKRKGRKKEKCQNEEIMSRDRAIKIIELIKL